MLNDMKLFLPALPLGAQEVPLTGRLCIYAYFVILGILCLYGLHRFLMVFLYYRYRRNAARPKERFEDLPPVTIQLPVYNELYVVERLIDAVCAIDYPRDRFEVQVLDDSTDETQMIACHKVEEMRSRGIDIHHIHRTDRAGYKAGALENGLKAAKGRFIAVFDADFLPKPEFLHETIHHFTDPQVGMVQTRWGHVNRDYSLLTKVQAILLDGHFMMEHTARNRSGRFINFSGTAGIWRREAIETAGGWQHDTLTEDLDLSFRSQLRSWKFVFLPEVVTPAELPVEMNGFKSQQHRWAKGSAQTSKKLLWKVVTAKLPLHVKLEGVVHLTGNIAYLLMVILAVIMFPTTIFRGKLQMQGSAVLDLVVFTLATISVCLFYLCSQWEIGRGRDWLAQIRYLPMLLAMGIGLCINNAKAVVEGFFGGQTEFVRTPKYNIQFRGDTCVAKKYRGFITTMVPLVELLMGLYFMMIIAYSIRYRMYGAIPFQMLFTVGFLYMAFLSFFQGKLTIR